MAAVTVLGAHGVSRPPNGSFSGKSADSFSALLAISKPLGIGQGAFIQVELFTNTGLTTTFGTPPYVIQTDKAGKQILWGWTGSQWIKLR